MAITKWLHGILKIEKPASHLQRRPVLIQIGPVKIGKVDQTLVIIKAYTAVLKGHQARLADFPQNAVHMDRGQARGIGEIVLRHRKGAFAARDHAAHVLGELEYDVAAFTHGPAPSS